MLSHWTTSREVQLSSDGVSECRSTSVSLDVYSIRIIGCQQVYPICIVRLIDKSYVHPENHLKNVIVDLIKNDFQIKNYIADNLKRATGKLCLNHASLFPCEYCFARGTRNHNQPKNLESFKKKMELKKTAVSEKLNYLRNNDGSKSEINTLKKIEKELLEEEKNGPKTRTNIVWPASSREGEPRTDEKLKEILLKIEENPNLPKNERMGVVGRSPLWDIPEFNFVRDSPAEYMHCVCIGVGKRTLELTFSVGEVRSRVTKRKLSSPTDFNALMLSTKVVRESSRRARKLDFAVMKAQEMRNLILFFVPHILECIEENAKERKLWLILCYLVRASVLPTKEFQVMLIDVIDLLLKEFYNLYEALFGISNCTYNTHMFGTHLIEIRAHGPVTLTSAFGFEAFYGEVRNSFTPGTQSCLKQIMQKVLLKRAISYHCCENSIYFSEKDSPQECNSLVYCYENNEYQMFKIIKVQKNSLTCYKQGKFQTNFKETSSLKLDWAKVGVFTKGGIMKTVVEVPKQKIAGKVLSVGNYLLTCPKNVLLEK